jgi:hypothetical protein
MSIPPGESARRRAVHPRKKAVLALRAKGFELLRDVKVVLDELAFIGAVTADAENGFGGHRGLLTAACGCEA